jgi:hypothetical protein
MASLRSQNELQERSLGDLTKKLSQDTSALVRKEVELARAEALAKVRSLARGGGLLGGAAILGLAAVGALTATAILALATTISAWLAALIVAVVIATVGGGLALVGIKRIRQATPPLPIETVESVKEDVEWIKTQAKSGLR